MLVPGAELAEMDVEPIQGLRDARHLLHEACVLPLALPELFRGIRAPWRGVLLFGPPGTGKTLLARDAAKAAGAAFFVCSPASLLRSRYGRSEKVVAALFDEARRRAPSIIFFDEVDALLSRRGASGEHEASRRLKSELLSQLDGVHSNLARSSRPRSNQEAKADRNARVSDRDRREGSSPCDPGPRHVVVVATTNRPWDLDEALLRRLEKRVHVPLPDPAARASLFRQFLSGVRTNLDLSETSRGPDAAGGAPPDAEDGGGPGGGEGAGDGGGPGGGEGAGDGGGGADRPSDLERLVEASEGYSGADIRAVCREAALLPFRTVVAGKTVDELRSLKAGGGLQAVPPVEVAHLERALATTKPTARDADAFVRWDRAHGSGRG
jgi:katanin p60 ATPase-containing subunit A1